MSGQLATIFKKETFSYLDGVQAWIIWAVYILISMFITFFAGGFFSINNDGLFSLFYFQPYIMAFIIPAVTMKLWSDERKTGTLEFLLTQPVSLPIIVLSKFLSAWFMCFCMLILTIPLWIYMNIYFETDNLNVLSGYLACLLTSGAFCAAGCLISTFCVSAAVSYLWGVIILFFISVNDFSSIAEALRLPTALESKLTKALSLNNHYYDMTNGQIGYDNVLFFALFILICLCLNVIIVEYKKD